MKFNWKTICKKTGIILLSTILFALCSFLLYITKAAGSLQTIDTRNEPELASAMTNENLNTETQEKLDGYWTIAIFGTDSRQGSIDKGNNADVQLLCSINRATGDIQLVSVYRDTYLLIDPAKGNYNKLAQSYFLQGPAGNISTLNRNLDLNVDDFIAFNWKSVVDTINLLGGVDIQLTKAEFYYINAFITETVAATGVPSSHLEESGMQHLDGVQAVAYMRLRMMDTDFARTERQRTVITQMFEKAREADVVTLARILDAVLPQVNTTIDQKGLLDIASNIRHYNITGTSAFPTSHTDAPMGQKGDVVIPNTLETNVEELHHFLYGDDSYTCSSQVMDISREIIKQAIKN